MPKGAPNDKSKLLNFVAKVYDPIAKAYKPIYELPDATNTVHGGVYLSDAIAGEANSLTGVEAATPFAVKKVNDNANNKLDKTQTNAQTVKSNVTFSGGLSGTLNGLASRANRLETPRTINVKAGSNGTAGSATFDGTANVTITIPNIDASAVTTGTLPTSVIPSSIRPKMVTVANQTERFALTTAQVKNGDTVYQTNTKTLYTVIDQTKLNQEAGYFKHPNGLGTISVGSNIKPVYISNGQPIASSATVGANNKPIYMANGNITASSFEVNKSVPANAVFTDTTYTSFKGATASAAGGAGLVPAPSAGYNNRFLRGDGTWQLVTSGVSGVKGNAESSYRTGQVNLTPANIGALSLTGGTLTGTLNTRAIVPTTTNTYDLGSATAGWKNIYALTVYGDLRGTALSATSADKLTKNIQLIGNVTSAATSLNVSNSTVQLSTTIANKTVGNAQLKDEVGTVYMGSTEPTDPHVMMWIKV